MISRNENFDPARLDFERLRISKGQQRLNASESLSDALPSFLGKVVSSVTNLQAGRFCKVAPTAVVGIDGEAQVGQFGSAGTGPVLVYLLGTHVPSPGDFVVCRFVDHRWVTELTGGTAARGTGVVLPSCGCLVPATLTMTSSDPGCNYRMFQSCTLQYAAPPPAMVAFGYKTNVFTSASLFPDPITGASFFYHFWCYYNQFYLTRIFPTSPMGSPYRDGVLYSWIVGGYANTCAPFQLVYGAAFPGSDATCSVSITG